MPCQLKLVALIEIPVFLRSRKGKMRLAVTQRKEEWPVGFSEPGKHSQSPLRHRSIRFLKDYNAIIGCDEPGVLSTHLHADGSYEHLLTVPAGAEEGPMVADYIGRILELNREITELAEAGRNALGSSIRAMGAGKKAQRAYGQNAR